MVSDYETDGSGTVVERYNKGADAVQALKQGKLDCVIIDELPALAFVEQNEGLKILEENFVEEDYAFVIAKGNEALVDQVNETLRELKDEGVLDNIAKNYTGTDEEIGKYPYEIMDVERTNGTLTVGTNAEFPPYEYYEEGKITGIDMDIMQAVCDKLGFYGDGGTQKECEFYGYLCKIQAGHHRERYICHSREDRDSREVL